MARSGWLNIGYFEGRTMRGMKGQQSSRKLPELILAVLYLNIQKKRTKNYIKILKRSTEVKPDTFFRTRHLVYLCHPPTELARIW